MKGLTFAQIAAERSISEKTVSRHRAAVEARYSIKVTGRMGRSLVVKEEYLELLYASIEGRDLPDSVSTRTTHVPSEDLIEAELVEDDQDDLGGQIVVQRHTSTVVPTERIAPLSVSLSTTDTTASDRQTDANWNALENYFDLLEEGLTSTAEAKGAHIASKMKEIISRKAASAVRDSVVAALESL